MESQPREERRSYFRLSVLAHLRLKEISPEERDRLAARIDDDSSDPCSLVNQLRSLSHHTGGLLAAVRKHDHDIAQLLALLDRKIELVARLVEGMRLDTARDSPTEIELSAGGFSFVPHAPLAPGTLLGVQLVLQPTLLCLRALGEVLETGEPPGQQRVEFTHLREEDREELARYLIEQQSAQLRRQRGEGGDGNVG